MRITKPSLRDVRAMQELTRPEVERGIILERSSDEIANAIRSYLVAKEGEKIIGFCALHIHSETLAEIRSLVVAQTHRDKGVGRAIVEEAIGEALQYGVSEVLVLTYRRSFFEKFGFIEVSKELIPDHKIWADCIKCKHFPLCDEIALIKKL